MLSLVAFVSAPAAAHADIDLPDGFATVTLASGLWDPTAFAYAPDGRIFIAEKRGRVRVVRPGGSQTAGTVIDISGHVANAGDRGLLGIAVDVDFETNHWLYLLYTYDADPVNWEAEKTARLTRITVNPDDTVGRVRDGPAGQHRAGAVPAAHQHRRLHPVDEQLALDRHGPLRARRHAVGRIRRRLRLQRDGPGSAAHVRRAARCPARSSMSTARGRAWPAIRSVREDDNLSHVCTKLYAMGFRNPFRFQLRPGGAGPVLGDVGWES